VANATHHIEIGARIVADVTHRTREEAVYDGSTGAQVDTRVLHELGIEVEGIFVPFLTKEGGYIDALVERGKAAQQAQQHTPPNQGGAQQTGAVWGDAATQGQQPTQTTSGRGDVAATQTPQQPSAASWDQANQGQSGQ
jgi:hypothetical protein